MKSFVSYVPTRLYFGVGEVQRLGAETARIGKRALLITGKGSAKRSGLLDKVVGLLRGENDGRRGVASVA